MTIESKEEEHAIRQAHQDVGPIQPWLSEDGKHYIFEHDAYPAVTYAGETVEETQDGYSHALTEFVKLRLAQKIDPIVDRMTSGRGGLRPGAGRKAIAGKRDKTVKIQSEIKDVVDWLTADPHRADQVRKLMRS